ncbi:MAG: hypothetical protein NVSMB27_17280 [Ktedonobacteraceae bacterium]
MAPFVQNIPSTYYVSPLYMDYSIGLKTAKHKLLLKKESQVDTPDRELLPYALPPRDTPPHDAVSSGTPAYTHPKVL